MQKGSHLDLATFIIDHTEIKQLEQHKHAFLLGNILPDLLPSFLFRRHEINSTFQSVIRSINRLSKSNTTNYKRKGFLYFVLLGQVTHYLADYFTYPHNSNYFGTFIGHCTHERRLKKQLRNYLELGFADYHLMHLTPDHNTEEILSYLQKKHQSYLYQVNDIRTDIIHIIDVNLHTVCSILAA